MSDELEKPGTTALAQAPDRRGLEGITNEDVELPRLSIAQGMTPQVAEGREGFVTGVMFNSTTEEVYGKGPLEFCVIRRDNPRWIEFFPREQGGGVKDFNVPANDPRTKYRLDANGRTLPPLATKFYDYIIMLLPIGDDPFERIMSLSFKATALRTARQFNMLLMARPPLFSGKYKITSVTKKNQKGTWAGSIIQNAGPLDDKTKALAEQFYETFKLADVSFVRDDVPDDGDEAPASASRDEETPF